MNEPKDAPARPRFHIDTVGTVLNRHFYLSAIVDLQALEWTRLPGYLTTWERKFYDAEEPTAGVPEADGRAGARWTNAGGVVSGVRAVRPVDLELGSPGGAR